MKILVLYLYFGSRNGQLHTPSGSLSPPVHRNYILPALPLDVSHRIDHISTLYVESIDRAFKAWYLWAVNGLGMVNIGRTLIMYTLETTAVCDTIIL